METFLRDLRHAVRLLVRSPGFSAFAIAALAIGIGANLTIFGFAHALLVSPPAGVADASRVVRVFSNRFSSTDYFNYEAYRDQNSTFVALAAFRAESVSLRTDGAPEQRVALAVSGNYFSALGVSTFIGRPIVPSDDDAGAASVVVLSDRFWRTRFAANPQVIGQPLTINGRPTTIVGVTPSSSTARWRPCGPTSISSSQRARLASAAARR